MNLQTLVSIIVPVYNVEQYIEKCLFSIINQTYRNIEIIVVNDGSTDNSIDIVNDLMKLDNRIILINKINGGLASARNAGVKLAKGKYIWHIDSDDYADSDSLLQMVKKAEDNKSDIVITGYKLVDYNYNCYGFKTCRFIGNISGEEALIGMLNQKIGGEVWTKLYRRDLYLKNNIVQDEFFSQVEDTMLNFQMFSHAKIVTACDVFTIFHVLRKGSYSDTSKSINFRKYHHNGLIKMQNYGFISLIVQDSYYAYLLFDYFQILKSKNITLLNELDINNFKSIYNYVNNFKYLPKDYIERNFILKFLYLFRLQKLPKFVSAIIFIWIKMTFKK